MATVLPTSMHYGKPLSQVNEIYPISLLPY